MVIDEEALRSLVASTLDGVGVPGDGPLRILAVAAGGGSDELRDPLRRVDAIAQDRAGRPGELRDPVRGVDAIAPDDEEVGGRDGGPSAVPDRRRHRLVLGGAAAAAVLAIVVGVGLAAGGGTPSSSNTAHIVSAPLTLAPSDRTPGGSASAGPSRSLSGMLSNGGVVNGPVAASAAGSTGAPALRSQAPTAPAAAGVPAAPSGTRVVQTGSLTVTVAGGQVIATANRLGAVAAGLGGSVTKSLTSPDAGAGSTADVTLQVPAAAFGSLVSQVEALGTPSSVSTSATDVTASYVDLTARIAALEASRQQFLAILAKAQTISDILAVENEITPLQTQIEQLQGQQQVLDQQSSTATLTVHVATKAPAAAPPVPGRSGLDKAWHRTTRNFTSGIESVVGALGGIAVFLVCVAALGVVARLGWGVARRRLV